MAPIRLLSLLVSFYGSHGHTLNKYQSLEATSGRLTFPGLHVVIMTPSRLTRAAKTLGGHSPRPAPESNHPARQSATLHILKTPFVDLPRHKGLSGTWNPTNYSSGTWANNSEAGPLVAALLGHRGQGSVAGSVHQGTGHINGCLYTRATHKSRGCF